MAEKLARGGATTYKQACDAILLERDQWAVLGGKIEQARRAAKIAIASATTAESVETIRAAALADLLLL